MEKEIMLKNKIIETKQIANNRATADFLISSPLMNEEYEHEVINFKQNIKERANSLKEE